MALTKDELIAAAEAVLAHRDVLARYLVAPAAVVAVQMVCGIDIECRNHSEDLIEITISRRNRG